MGDSTKGPDEREVAAVLRSLEGHAWTSDDGGYSLDSHRCAALIRSLSALAQRAGEVAAESCADHVAGEVGYCTFLAAVPFGTMLYTAPPVAAGDARDDRAEFDKWFRKEIGACSADTTDDDRAWLPWRAWKARAALTQEQPNG